MSIRERILIQKYIVKWIKDNDINSRYFYCLVKGRSRRNFIGYVVNDIGVDTVVEVKEAIMEHFMEKFLEPGPDRPNIDGVAFKALSDANKVFSEDCFSDVEIKSAVWGCEGSKSLGPYMYNFVFIRNC